MINVFLKEGLGNNLFQYAVGKHLAVKNNTTIRLIIKTKHDILGRKIIKRLGYFRIEAKQIIIEPISYATMIHERIGRLLGIHWLSCDGRVYYEKGWGFDPEVLAFKDGIYLDGFFQSEKYFKDIEHIIRNDLRFREDSFGEESATYKELIAKQNSVGLHIRRSDYLMSNLHNVCNMRYYNKSVAYMQNQLVSPYFFVFSDDIEWCSENLHISNGSFVNIQASKKNPIIDLQLMSLCKHNIISNSTFSWWAAWLNENHEKIVVAPNRWFNDEILNAQALRDTIPDDWIRLDF